MKHLVILLAIMATCSCTPSTNNTTIVTTLDTVIGSQKTKELVPLYVDSSFDIQGHRGCRGLYPENTVEGFIKAMELGVTTLEMDIVLSHDNKLVVSHEAYMRAQICTLNATSIIDSTNEKQYNIYQLNYDSIAKYDCGTKPYARFPNQQKTTEHKPLLHQVLLAVVQYCTTHNVAIPCFNIEIKTELGNNYTFNPAPNIVAQKLYNELHKLRMLKTVTIQSFDVRALQAMKRIDAQVPIALLVENKLSLEQNIAQLRFMPQIYSCNYQLATKELIANAHQRNIKVIPWTVNDTATMQQLIHNGVDGIITDYPNIIRHKK
jgi:glycerophosphoryl diester phosphodiesterase